MVNRNNKQIYLKLFAESAGIYILNMVNLNDVINKEVYEFNDDEYYWRIYKTVLDGGLIEISIKRSNYNPSNIKDKPRGNRIYERSYVYITNSNINFATGTDASIGKKDGLILGGLSFQNYKIQIE
jgi:hypothetical protein